MPFCKALLRAPKPPPPGYPSDPTTLGEHIRKRRLDLGLTQKELAGLLGVDEWTVINWEVRGRKPAVGSMPVVVKFLGHLPDGAD